MIAHGLSLLVLSTFAATDFTEIPTLLKSKIVRELQKKIAHTQIELLPVSSRTIPESTSVLSVKYISESTPGIADMGFVCDDNGTLTETKVKIPYKATVQAAMASKRVKFGQLVTADDYFMQEVDVTSGLYKEIRGLLITDESQLSKMQAHQTLLENQPILSSALIPSPDVSRGDAVKVRLLSGGLSIQTAGIAQEPSRIGQSIKVLSLKTKRELSGILLEGNTVEVQL